MSNHGPQVAAVFVYDRTVTRDIKERQAIPGQFRGFLLKILIPRAALGFGPASGLPENQSTNPSHRGGDLCP